MRPYGQHSWDITEHPRARKKREARREIAEQLAGQGNDVPRPEWRWSQPLMGDPVQPNTVIGDALRAAWREDR
ncbi:MAG: hypothetical protein ACI9K2_006638 [Myxococcota bacterium]|jgi:hypothetical protein